MTLYAVPSVVTAAFAIDALGTAEATAAFMIVLAGYIIILKENNMTEYTNLMGFDAMAYDTMANPCFNIRR